MSSTDVSVKIWPRTFIITETAFQLSPHAKLSPFFLKKILPYVKEKSKRGIGKVSQKMWRHICVNKLQMSEEIGNFYFEYFLLLTSSPAERLQSIAHLGSANNLDKMTHFNQMTAGNEGDMRKIDIYAFMCYLFFQQFHKLSLKSSYSSATNEWPGGNSSHDLSASWGDNSMASRKVADEQSIVLFFIEKLGSLLEVLASHTSGYLSLKALSGLDFLFEGRVHESLEPIGDLAVRALGSGYNRESNTFTVSQFNQWLCGTLVVSPFGMQTSQSLGLKIPCPVPGIPVDSSVGGSSATIRSKIIVSTGNYIPRSVMLAHITKQTLAKTGALLQDNCIKLFRCTNSFIYLLDSVKSVHLLRCKNTTVVVGSVSTVLSVNECKNMRIIAACGKLSIQKTENSTFHILTNTNPLLLYENENLTLAPFNTWYASFTHHLTRAGLSLGVNFWNTVYCPIPEQKQSWNILKPDNFNLFAIPFAFPELQGVGNENSSAENVLKYLPGDYAKSWIARQSHLTNWRGVFDSITSEEQRLAVSEVVMNQFKHWLSSERLTTEIDSLALLTLGQMNESNPN
ncbi:TBCC domain-containing protein 1-like [Symsagittifera roscoffensis]|uniref:TBCC domain-containing protein 1-like n=1 Tax=Symsagittifera roscoffensis TaxID=84072 RepID=UPI00307C4141